MEKKTKILICGDSFAADWTVKYNDYLGWPNLLAQNYNVKNIAQAGVGQFKIYKQLQSVNIKDFDVVISSYTSPYRVHTYNHPVHSNDLLHKNCDAHGHTRTVGIGLVGICDGWICQHKKICEKCGCYCARCNLRTGWC